MAFGFSFGKNKTSSRTNSTINRVESGIEEGLQNQTQTNSTNSTGSSSTSGSSTSTGSTATQGSTSTQSNSTQNQTGQSRSFSSEVLGGLEGAVGSLLSSVFSGESGDRSSIGAGYNYMGEFDPQAFVSGSLAKAQAQEESKMDELLGGLLDTIGGKNNSAAALLGNRIVNDSTANLAGIEGDLQAKASEIVRNNVLAGNQIDQTNDQRLQGLLEALKGGITEQAQTSQTTGAETQNTSQTGQSSATEATSQQQNTQTSEVSNLISVLSSLLNTNTNTTATENSTTRGRSSGGGLSLSI